MLQLLIMLFFGAGLAGASDDDDDRLIDDPLPEDPLPEDPEPLVTEDTEGSIAIEVQASDARDLVAVKYEDITYEDTGAEVITYDLVFYMQPQGAEIPIDPDALADTTPETRADLEAALGLDPVYAVDLGVLRTDFIDTGVSLETFVDDQRMEAPEVTSNKDFDIYRVTTSPDETEGQIFGIQDDESLSPFEEKTPSYNSAFYRETSVNFTGSDTVDWVAGMAAGLTITGEAGDDYLLAFEANTKLTGGEGDDSLMGFGDQSRVSGNAGNDTIHIFEEGLASGGNGADEIIAFRDGSTVFGGNGGDRLSAFDIADERTEVYGEGGDDTIFASGVEAYVDGGDGADTINLVEGAKGTGGAGDDYLALDPGAEGDGGEGDDYLLAANFFGEDAALATGGAGADTFDSWIRIPTLGAEDVHMTITDFDPEEDMLLVQAYDAASEITGVEITQTSDVTEVRLQLEIDTFEGVATSIIRLEGAPDVSVEDVVIVT